MDNVVRFERLENYKALSLYYCADIVFAFYDPVLPINRKAAANKWWDCVTCKVPFISNSEVETLKPFREAEACFVVPYRDSGELINLLNELEQNSEKIETVKENFTSLSTYSWGDRMDMIVKESLAKES